MSQGIRLNLIGLWLQDKRGEEFYEAVESIRKKVTPAAFSSFLDVWRYATDNYKTRLTLPSIGCDPDHDTMPNILRISWSDTDHDMQFLVHINPSGRFDWCAYDHHTGWSQGSEEEYSYLFSIHDIPLDIVTRCFKIEDNNVEAC